MTTQTADMLPAIAAHTAKNGVLFSVGLVQTGVVDFSKPLSVSVIPTREQQKQTFRALLSLKRRGFIRNNTNYLTRALGYYGNTWICDPEQDSFIKIGAGGRINVCAGVGTGLKIGDILSLNDQEWRKRKGVGVAYCGGCMFHCYYESENPNVIGDLPMIGVGVAIKAGAHSLVEKWGQRAAAKATQEVPEVNWQLKLV